MRTFLRHLRILPLAALAALSACSETVNYTAAFLVTVRSEVAVDCIVLTAQNAGAGEKVETKHLSPEWRSAFREKQLKVLVYQGGALSGDAVDFVAVGRRDSCDGQDVAEASARGLVFTRQVEHLEIVLLPKQTDADKDGWMAFEDCVDSDSDIFPGGPELCDNRDNDCDESSDEGCACTAPRPCWPSRVPLTFRNVGACRDGTQGCSNTFDELEACTDYVLAGVETCDGTDQDCDGATDEGVSCAGALVCRRGRCAPEHELFCDGGTDEDNDALADCADLEDCTGRACGAAGGTCCSGACVVQEIACGDGVDNDCDGSTDCADGACDNLNCGGNRVCASLGCHCPNGDDATELCNGVDDDCDAETDELWKVGGLCAPGLGECQRIGVVICTAPDSAGCSVAAGVPAGPESCTDALDNDCDGATDCAQLSCSGLGCQSDGNPCTADLCEDGICGHNPTPAGTCCGPGLRCALDVCGDGGSEGLAACADGVDNDCDGKTDCADVGCNLRACATDNNSCTNDACGSLACQHTAVGGTACCEAGKRCSGAVCAAVAAESAGFCADATDNDCDGTTDCVDLGCGTHPCTTDNNSCTIDECGSNLCQHTALPANTCCSAGQACISNTCQAAPAENTGPRCSDNTDNDCDGATDCGETACGGVCIGNLRGCSGGAAVTWSSGDENTVAECHNSMDDDCDGLTDCQESTCRNGGETVCNDRVDDNCDGETDCQDGDCDQGATETNCIDNRDNDCDGMTDCADTTTCTEAGVAEICSNGVDDDCENLVDCADSECGNGTSCGTNKVCCPSGCIDQPAGRLSCDRCSGAGCSSDNDCCEGSCGGPPGNKTCR